MTDPEYLEARALALQLAKTEGIDRVMAEHDLDAVLSPSYAFGSSAPAVAGYPVMSVPVGVSPEGIPAGVWLYAGFLQEPQLLHVGYAIEQLMSPREQPEFLGAVPADPPNAGLCPVPTAAARRRRARNARKAGPMHPATGRRPRKVH